MLLFLLLGLVSSHAGNACHQISEPNSIRVNSAIRLLSRAHTNLLHRLYLVRHDLQSAASPVPVEDLHRISIAAQLAMIADISSENRVPDVGLFFRDLSEGNVNTAHEGDPTRGHSADQIHAVLNAFRDQHGAFSRSQFETEFFLALMTAQNLLDQAENLLRVFERHPILSQQDRKMIHRLIGKVYFSAGQVEEYRKSHPGSRWIDHQIQKIMNWVDSR